MIRVHRIDKLLTFDTIQYPFITQIMKYKYLLTSIIAAFLLLSNLHGQSLKPGTVTFQNIYGMTSAQNINTGITEEITDVSLLTEGFVISSEENAYLDLIFSNGVVGRLSPNSKLEIESFAVQKDTSDQNSATNSTYSRSMRDQPILKLKLEYGDIILNATAKDEGDLIITTPLSEVKSGPSKLFVSYGLTKSENQSVSRTINLGSDIIELTSNVSNSFSDIRDQIIYGYYDAFASPKTVFLYADNSAVIRNEKEVAKSEIRKTEKVNYSLLPLDDCSVEQLETVSDQILVGGINPLGYVLVIQSDSDSTYLDTNTGEIDNIQPGMKLPEGTIIRSSMEGLVSIVFPNGTTSDIEASSNVYLEKISTQPVLSKGSFEFQTNVITRVETGKLVTNMNNTPGFDTFTIISPLDTNLVPTDTVLSVEFKQLETSAFQSITKNITPVEQNGTGITGRAATTASRSGNSSVGSDDFGGIAVATIAQASNRFFSPIEPGPQRNITTVITATGLTFISDNVSFVEYAADGQGLTFSIPPGGTHITESRIIPPSYAFIDRTIAFAAGVVPGPTPVGTPDNPGNDIQPGDEEDPVSP
jgi:hypothetical protein